MKSFLSFLLGLLTLISTLQPVHSKFTWDKDTPGVDCEARKEAGQCITDDTTWFMCAETCANTLKSAGNKLQGEPDDPEEFWEVKTPLSNGKQLSMDRFEGYVTLVLIIPLMPGMAQYYYDMLEHILTVHPYSLEIIVSPIRKESYPDYQLKLPDKKSKIIMLPEIEREGGLINPNPLLKYLEDSITKGKAFAFTDRVTAYIVSVSGGFIERHTTPSLEFMLEWIAHYLTEMDHILKSEF